MTQAQLSRIETGGSPIVHIDKLIQWATVLEIPPALLWFSLPADHGSSGGVLDVTSVAADASAVLQASSTSVFSEFDTQVSGLDSPFDSPFDIIRRMQELGVSAMDELTLIQLESLVSSAIDDYERVGPASLASTLVVQRRWVDGLLREHHPPRRATRLFALASQMSGVLASIALDLRSIGAARAYAAEAFQLSEMIANPDLSAWARGTQSLIEYYAGRYIESLEFARDGLALSPAGPQVIRLTVNGEARALARLGDADGVNLAVDRAMQLYEDLPPSRSTVSPSLTLGPYCSARIDGNAATAFLILSKPEKVLYHGARALAVFDPVKFQGPRVLTRIDMATALVSSAHPDPSRAAYLVHEALEVEGANGFASVIQRAEEFVQRASRFSMVPEIAEAARRVRELPVPEMVNLDEEG